MRIVPLLAATAAALGVVGWMAWSHEARIDAAVERATAELDASRPMSAESKRATELLDELDARIAECVGTDDTIAPPWTWHPAFDLGLRSRLAPLGPFLDAVEEVHGSEAVAHVLEHGHRLDRHTSLLWSRERTNVLCAQAIVDARDGRSAAAAERIAQAFDLARVDFDPSSIELMLSSAFNDIVFDALRRILMERHVDPTVLEARLAAGFADAARAPSFLECLRSDALWLLATDWSRSEWQPGRIERWNLRASAAERLRSIADGTFVVPVPRTSIGDPDADVDAHLTAVVARVAIANGRRIELARLALSLAAQRARSGRWPESVQHAVLPPAAGSGNEIELAWIVECDEARLMARVEDQPDRIEVWDLR